MVLGLPALRALLRKKAPARHPLDGAVLYAPCETGAIAVDVKGSAIARRLILRLDRLTGRPRLTVPRGVSKASAERFLHDHVGWISARLKALPEKIAFDDGVIIPIRGVPHRIALQPGLRGATQQAIVEGEAVLHVHGDRAHLSRRVLSYLKAQALLDYQEASTRYAKIAGVTLGRISIKDTKSRWGSCSAKGDLAYSWRMILAPPEILDYLAAHEVAHRLEMNHSPRYWRHVAHLCPTYRTAEDWLKRHAGRLHLYGRG
jgi:predicted metal-dependent hydrolase